jgi:repressor LexA
MTFVMSSSESPTIYHPPLMYASGMGLTASCQCVTIGYMMTGAQFRRLREQLGLTQEQLAEALHTTRVSIARYESGMRKIGGAVQVAIAQLASSGHIPLVGTVAAGIPIEPVPQSELIDVPTSMTQSKDVFALRVKGESMIEDGILPGDLVIVRKQPTARNGQTVVALVNREATIKTYIRKGDRIELHPANAAMAPLVVTPEDEFAIEGVLIGVIRYCSNS